MHHILTRFTLTEVHYCLICMYLCLKRSIQFANAWTKLPLRSHEKLSTLNYMNQQRNKSSFSPKDITSLKGVTVIVTGGNCGIGFEVVKTMYRNGATVFMASRSKERAVEAIATLIAGVSGDFDPVASKKSWLATISRNGADEGKIDSKVLPKDDVQKFGSVEFLELDLQDFPTVKLVFLDY